MAYKSMNQLQGTFGSSLKILESRITNERAVQKTSDDKKKDIWGKVDFTLLVIKEKEANFAGINFKQFHINECFVQP